MTAFTAPPLPNSALRFGGGSPQASSAAWWLLALFILLHIPLGIVLREQPVGATAHALLTAAVALAVALRKGPSEHVAWAGAYITGSEVLWRMCRAVVIWEFGKYALVVVFVVALFRAGKSRAYPPALIYFGLLLPAVPFTLYALDAEQARQQISFNLSGPLALAVSVWFFSNVRLESARFLRLLVFIIAPACSIAAVAATGIAETSKIQLTNGSNAALSGNFGPNQVAAALGLGAFATLLCLLHARLPKYISVLLMAIAVALAAQSALTFSRGGIYNAAVGLACGAAFLMRDRAGTRLVATCMVLLPAAAFLVLPALDSFTEGRLSSRFADTDPTHRDELLYGDLELFVGHPVFGVGPGVSIEERDAPSGANAAHTEYTRLLGEHGLFGLVALALLLRMPFEALRRARGARQKALAVSFISWSLAYMLVNGVRMAAPCFMYGLAFLSLSPAVRHALLVMKPQGARDVWNSRNPES